MLSADTIIAPATPPGASARAIIRISGVGATRVARACHGGGGPIQRRMTSGRIAIRHQRADGDVVVPVLLACFPAPRSYTGEDVLEIQLPGNPYLVARVVESILSLSNDQLRFRLAEPGEFTARAYMNSRLTLAQAEGVAATIAARTREQLAAASELLKGRTGDRYHAMAEEVSTLLALVEAGIDFTDQEDVVPIPPRELDRRLHAVVSDIDVFLSGTLGREAIDALPRVALAGRPNSGKSTLFNALLGRPRAVAAPIAGTTRDVLAEELDLSRDAPGSGKVILEDLPGLDASAAMPVAIARAESQRTNREAAEGTKEIEQQSQHAARSALSQADVILWCDPSGRFDATDSTWADRPAGQVIRVRTFADQATDGGLGAGVVQVCALDGWNLGVLRRAMADAACASSAAGVAALLPRHRRALSLARQALDAARADVSPALESLTEPELIADSLRAALDAIGELVGQISPDEILGRVFASFCVGK